MCNDLAEAMKALDGKKKGGVGTPAETPFAMGTL